MSQLALGFLDAVGQADLPRALALADSCGDSLDLVDDAIQVVGERLRTGQAPRETVAAIRVLWEMRYRLATTNVPRRTALPVLVAEIATVIADLEHPLRTATISSRSGSATSVAVSPTVTPDDMQRLLGPLGVCCGGQLAPGETCDACGKIYRP